MPSHHTPAPARAIAGRRLAWFFALVPILFALFVIAFVPEGERESLGPGHAARRRRQHPGGRARGAAARRRGPGRHRAVDRRLRRARPGDPGRADQAGDRPAVAVRRAGGWTGRTGRARTARPASRAGRRTGPRAGPRADRPVAARGSSPPSWCPRTRPRRSSPSRWPPTSTPTTSTRSRSSATSCARTRPTASRSRSPARRPSRPTSARSSTAPTSGCSPRPPRSWRILLIITYRSPVLWLVPLTVVGIADRLAAIVSTNVLEAVDVAWDESTVGILSVLVFGAGTDYALLLISRYRDELKTTESRHEAMAHALGRTAEAVLSSATTVVLGLLTLLLSAIPTTRGPGPGLRRRRRDRRDLRPRRAAGGAGAVRPVGLLAARARTSATPVLVDSRSLWRRVGDAVARRPRDASSSARSSASRSWRSAPRPSRPASTRPTSSSSKPEAIAAAERLGESFPAGTSDPVQVLTRDEPETGPRRGREGRRRRLRARHQHRRRHRADRRRARRRPRAATSAQADRARRPRRPSPTSTTPTSAAATPRRSTPSEYAASDRQLILPLILLLVLGALLLLLRSVVAPLLLVATVVATYAASMGASWWLFQTVFGFEAMDTGVPLLAFLFLVALGVDYNIFLVTRAREEAREHGTRDGHAARADRHRRRDHQRRHPARRGLRRARRAAAGGARPARRDHLRRRAARHARRPHGAGAGARAAPSATRSGGRGRSGPPEPGAASGLSPRGR